MKLKINTNMATYRYVDRRYFKNKTYEYLNELSKKGLSDVSKRKYFHKKVKSSITLHYRKFNIILPTMKN